MKQIDHQFNFYTIMKTIINFLAVIMLGISFYACQNSSETDSGVKHFRQMQFSETPFDLEKGVRQITAEEAKTVNNYQFTYDDMSRLTEVAYCRDTILLPYGSMRGTARITYTYEGNKQIKHYFNTEGEQIESGGAYEAVYTLDDNAMRTAMAFYDKDGNPIENRNNIHRYTWNKLDNGLIQELRYNLADTMVVMNPFCPFYELRFEYDDNGYCTRMMNYEADTLTNCTAENCGDIGVSYFEFANNDAGDVLSFSVHNTIGQLSNLYWGWAKRLNTVDENGYVTETAVYDQDDEYLSGNNVPVTKNIYDEHGAVVETWSLDKNRNLMNSPRNGVAIVAYKYDELGNRTETTHYNKDRVEVVTD